MERKLAAIFSTDVKGYSRLMGDNEEATIRTLKTYRDVITNLIEQHHGRVVDSPGDNMLAEFASAVDAVKSAVAIQRELKTRNAKLETHRQMEFRIGLNVGDVITDEGRLYGDGVNIAARLEGLADSGGICISESVHMQVRNKLSLEYDYIGEREVKNIANPVPVYKVQLEPDAAKSSAVIKTQPIPSPGEEKRTSRRWSMAALAVVAVLLVGAGVLVLRDFSQPPMSPQESTPSEEPPALPLPDKPSIAVLPLTNMSGDPEQEYFSDGMTETLITDLSKISGLFVIARNSTFAYKGTQPAHAQVRRELGVRYLLEGSVQKAGNQVRINTQLIDTTTGGHMWAERYDRKLEDIFALQDEVTQQIVAALEVTLTADEQEQLWRRNTDNLDAYDFFLRGQAYAFRFTKETNGQARQMYERALELDPAYADAYAALGGTHLAAVIFQWSQVPQTLERAYELAQKALALNDSLALPHLFLGQVYLWRDRQHDQAIAAVEKALALDPNLAGAYEVLAEILNFAGRPEEALGMIETAMRLNPHYPSHYILILGWTYLETRRYDEAITAYKRTLALNPDLLYAHLDLAVIYSVLGQEAQARAEVAELLRLNPNFSLEVWKQTMPVKDPAALAPWVAVLRKAGLE